MNSAAIKENSCPSFGEMCVYLSLGIYLGVELLNHREYVCSALVDMQSGCRYSSF